MVPAFCRVRSEEGVAKTSVVLAVQLGTWRCQSCHSGRALEAGRESGYSGSQTERRYCCRRNAFDQDRQLTSLRLFNLHSGIVESIDGSAENEVVFAVMSAALHLLYGEVQAVASPWPAWEWPRYESMLIQGRLPTQSQQQQIAVTRRRNPPIGYWA